MLLKKKDDCLYYIMPLASFGNVNNLRIKLKKENDQKLKRLVTKMIAQDILIGMYQMHKFNYYHLDIKCENMVVTEDGRCLIIDFGCSEKIVVSENQDEKSPLIKFEKDEENKRWKANGDSTYFSPERENANSNNYDFFDAMLSDSYSIGLSLWELVTGEKIGEYRENTENQNFDPHKVLFLHPLFKNSNDESDSLIDLVKKMIDPDLNKRWNIKEALNHPSLQSTESHDKEMKDIVISYLSKFIKSQIVGVGENHNNNEEKKENDESSSVQHELLKKLINSPFKNLNLIDIEKQQNLYIPLSASLNRELKDPFDLFDNVLKWIKNEDKLLTILADGGSGKSTFVQHLTLKLIQNLKKNENYC